MSLSRLFKDALPKGGAQRTPDEVDRAHAYIRDFANKNILPHLQLYPASQKALVDHYKAFDSIYKLKRDGVYINKDFEILAEKFHVAFPSMAESARLMSAMIQPLEEAEFKELIKLVTRKKGFSESTLTTLRSLSPIQLIMFLERKSNTEYSNSDILANIEALRSESKPADFYCNYIAWAKPLPPVLLLGKPQKNIPAV